MCRTSHREAASQLLPVKETESLKYNQRWETQQQHLAFFYAPWDHFTEP